MVETIRGAKVGALDWARFGPQSADVMSIVSRIAQVLDSQCELPSDFGVAPRYPGWEPVAGDIDKALVLVAARDILDWALRRTGVAEAL